MDINQEKALEVMKKSKEGIFRHKDIEAALGTDGKATTELTHALRVGLIRKILVNGKPAYAYLSNWLGPKISDAIKQFRLERKMNPFRKNIAHILREDESDKGFKETFKLVASQLFWKEPTEPEYNIAKFMAYGYSSRKICADCGGVSNPSEEIIAHIRGCHANQS